MWAQHARLASPSSKIQEQQRGARPATFKSPAFTDNSELAATALPPLNPTPSAPTHLFKLGAQPQQHPRRRGLDVGVLAGERCRCRRGGCGLLLHQQAQVGCFHVLHCIGAGAGA